MSTEEMPIEPDEISRFAHPGEQSVPTHASRLGREERRLPDGRGDGQLKMAAELQRLLERAYALYQSAFTPGSPAMTATAEGGGVRQDLIDILVPIYAEGVAGDGALLGEGGVPDVGLAPVEGDHDLVAIRLREAVSALPEQDWPAFLGQVVSPSLARLEQSGVRPDLVADALVPVGMVMTQRGGAAALRTDMALEISRYLVDDGPDPVPYEYLVTVTQASNLCSRDRDGFLASTAIQHRMLRSYIRDADRASSGNFREFIAVVTHNLAATIRAWVQGAGVPVPRELLRDLIRIPMARPITGAWAMAELTLVDGALGIESPLDVPRLAVVLNEAATVADAWSDDTEAASQIEVLGALLQCVVDGGNGASAQFFNAGVSLARSARRADEPVLRLRLITNALGTLWADRVSEGDVALLVARSGLDPVVNFLANCAEALDNGQIVVRQAVELIDGIRAAVPGWQVAGLPDDALPDMERITSSLERLRPVDSGAEPSGERLWEAALRTVNRLVEGPDMDNPLSATANAVGTFVRSVDQDIFGRPYPQDWLKGVLPAGPMPPIEVALVDGYGWADEGPPVSAGLVSVDEWAEMSRRLVTPRPSLAAAVRELAQSYG
ncbi:MAG TPA: hypothetical protein VH479_26135 [Acidimicrobiales bacterium]